MSFSMACRELGGEVLHLTTHSNTCTNPDTKTRMCNKCTSVMYGFAAFMGPSIITFSKSLCTIQIELLL